MTGLAATLVPIFLAAVSAPLAASDLIVYLQWVHVWVPTLGILGVGLRDLVGGNDDGPDEAVEADVDFLGEGLGAPPEDDLDGVGDGLGTEHDGGLGEVEPRIDDLEAELAELSSTVSAIHGEHETMLGSVEDIEENIRKLLEVYEVVTQGANPFADDPRAVAAGTGGFGLLEQDGGEPAADGTDLGEETLFDDVAEGPTSAEVEEEEEGLSFDDLKTEFEFVGEGETAEASPARSPPVPDDATGHEPDDIDDSSARSNEATPAAEQPTSDDGEKPYLADLPGGFGAELVVMEWLHYLVDESSVAEAMRAVRYYRTVDWIGDGVASHLQTVLSGMNPNRELAATDGGRPTELSVDHHTRSLEYISQLGDLHAGTRQGTAGALSDLGPGREDRGIQR